jgi:hypothetical protein
MNFFAFSEPFMNRADPEIQKWIEWFDAKGIKTEVRPHMIKFLDKEQQEGWVLWREGEESHKTKRDKVREMNSCPYEKRSWMRRPV